MSCGIKNRYVQMYPDCDVSELADGAVMDWADWYIDELHEALRVARDVIIAGNVGTLSDRSKIETLKFIGEKISGRGWE